MKFFAEVKLVCEFRMWIFELGCMWLSGMGYVISSFEHQCKICSSELPFAYIMNLISLSLSSFGHFQDIVCLCVMLFTYLSLLQVVIVYIYSLLSWQKCVKFLMKMIPGFAHFAYDKSVSFIRTSSKWIDFMFHKVILFLRYLISN